MNITVFGTGYVGLVTGACLAEVGNYVTCVDIDEEKIARLEKGEIPIFEPGLEALVAENHAAGRLDFTTEPAGTLDGSHIAIVAVGTPSGEDGSADLQYVLEVARTIGRHISDYTVVMDKSTVPVGTADRVSETIGAELVARGVDVEFDVVSNPEFLKEGAAVGDFMKPERIIIGSTSKRAITLLRQLYAPFNRNRDRVLVMGPRSAELTKYAANAMLATKISFMNEVANIAEKLGADIEHIRQGIGSDPRIGYEFIYPGAGFGGSCFPKDVRALLHMAQAHGYEAALAGAVEQINERQKNRLFEQISRHFDGQLAGKTIALWGLAFKPNTDDMREAPSRNLIEALWRVGAKIRAFDPEAGNEARRLYGERDDLMICDDPYQTLDGADAMAIATEWQLFRSPDFKKIRSALVNPVIFDGRNLYDPDYVEANGLAYYAVGRGRV